jgi:DNA-directed RNA polymerase subunit RPC12/RpoP
MVKLIPAKCPSCAAELEFPENMEVGHCMHCGGKVIIDKEVHVHGQTAIACPECGGKGYSPCEIEETITEELVAFQIKQRINTKHDSKKIKNVKQSNNRTTLYKRAMGCGGSGICVNYSVQTYNQKSGNTFYLATTTTNWCINGKCAVCKGRGKIGFIPCGTCKGTGTCLICEGSGKCTICDGTGKIRCEVCDGTGFKVYKG